MLRAVRRMGALRIDAIRIVARNPYLVLWSRLSVYEPHWLDELLAEGKLFEYWLYEACFLPIEDYLLYRHRMLDAESQGWHYSCLWVEAHRQDFERLLAFVRERGPMRAADFERTDGKAGAGGSGRLRAGAGNTLHGGRADDRATAELPEGLRPA